MRRLLQSAPVVGEERPVDQVGGADPRPDRVGQDPVAGQPGWFEIDLDAIGANLEQIRKRTGAEVMPVVKNNAYGLELVTTGKILEQMPQVWGLAVVKTEAALELKAAGIGKPVVLMALFADEDGPELVASGGVYSYYEFWSDAEQRSRTPRARWASTSRPCV